MRNTKDVKSNIILNTRLRDVLKAIRGISDNARAVNKIQPSSNKYMNGFDDALKSIATAFELDISDDK